MSNNLLINFVYISTKNEQPITSSNSDVTTAEATPMVVN